MDPDLSDLAPSKSSIPLVLEQEQKAKENEQKFMMGAENAMEAANKGVVIAPAEAPKSPEKIDPQQFKKRIRKASKKARRKK